MLDRKELAYTLLRAYFRKKEIAEHQKKSFNAFVEVTLPKIIKELEKVEPNVLPPGVEKVEIRFGEVTVNKPQIKEFGGYFREIYPMEARIRNLTYESPIFVEMQLVEDGKVVDEKKMYIGSIPIMLKSKLCWLYGLSEEELIELGEDPKDPGGYFIINGSERVIVGIEDLTPNKVILEKSDDPKYPWVARIFSERGQYRVLHLIEKSREGIVYISFGGRIRRLPIIILLKALGIDRDDVLYQLISEGDESLSTDLYLNLLEAKDIQSTEDALEYIGKQLGLLTRKRRIMRAEQLIDTILLPHLGQKPENRIDKLLFLAKVVRKLLYFSYGKREEDDVDHLGYKKLRTAGELMALIFRAAFVALMLDIRNNYEKMVRRGKKPILSAVVRPDVFTGRILGPMATGEWPGERTGVTQFMDKWGHFQIISHLYRVTSPLEEKREMFEARDLHGTHWGRYCACETTESIAIGLRKNLAILAEVTPDIKFDEESLIRVLKARNLLVTKDEELKQLGINVSQNKNE